MFSGRRSRQRRGPRWPGTAGPRRRCGDQNRSPPRAGAHDNHGVELLLQLTDTRTLRAASDGGVRNRPQVAFAATTATGRRLLLLAFGGEALWRVEHVAGAGVDVR